MQAQHSVARHCKASHRDLGLQVADIEKAEREKMREKVNNIIGHGINCFINRQVRRPG